MKGVRRESGRGSTCPCGEKKRERMRGRGCSSLLSCNSGGNLAIVQIGVGCIWQKSSISGNDTFQMKEFCVLTWSTVTL